MAPLLEFYQRRLNRLDRFLLGITVEMNYHLKRVPISKASDYIEDPFMRRFSFLLIALSLGLMQPIVTNTLLGSEPEGRKLDDSQVAEETGLDFFQAIEDGTIEVKFIPKDASQANLIIRNNTDQPVNLHPPATFGAVHVLGQMGMGMGGMGMGGMGMGGMGGMGMGGMGGMGGMMGGMGGMGQGMGGGMMGGMGGMGGMMGGMGGMGGMGMGGMGMGGMMRVAPNKPTKLTVPCVCLEHGKPDPNPRMKYQIVPLEYVNSDPRVAELCSLLGQGRIPQNTAQAAAWHFTDGLTWEELSQKNRVESRYTGNVRFFTPGELQAAFQLSNTIQVGVSESASHSPASRYQQEEVTLP